MPGRRQWWWNEGRGRGVGPGVRGETVRGSDLVGWFCIIYCIILHNLSKVLSFFQLFISTAVHHLYCTFSVRCREEARKVCSAQGTVVVKTFSTIQYITFSTVHTVIVQLYVSLKFVVLVFYFMSNVITGILVT